MLHPSGLLAVDSLLVQIDSKVWGLGKTSTVHGLLLRLQRERGLRVGGFTLPRVYGALGNQFGRHTGYEARLWSTDDHLEIARTDRPEWFHNQPGEFRKDVLEPKSTFHVDLRAVESLVQHCRRDLEDPDIQVLVFDELGPILMRGPTRAHRRGRLVQGLVHESIASEKPLVIVVYGDVRQKIPLIMETRQRCRARSLGSHRIPHSYLLRQENFRFLSGLIARDLLAGLPSRAGA